MDLSDLLSRLDAAAREGVTQFDLSNQGLRNLPPEIGLLTELTQLNLSGNFLEHVPTELSRLDKLTKLNLRSNRFREFPAEILSLSSLVELNLRWNQLSRLGSSLSSLSRLQRLDLRDNELLELPTEIAKLTALTSLGLGGNRLKELPDEFRDLASLKSLDLSRNQLKEFPVQVTVLQNLTQCDISNNRLKNLPPEFVKLVKLTSLKLSGNQLKEWPPEATKLTKLKQVAIGSNQLKELPSEIAKLSKLATLDLSGNAFKKLPSELKKLAKLSRLIRLSLRKSQLKRFPAELSKLTGLTELDLSANKLSELPKTIGQLTKLRHLNLRRNLLRKLPPEVAKLSQCAELDLGQNQLSQLPVEVTSLDKLVRLDLRENKLTSLPNGVVKLRRLERLDLRGNSFGDVPAQIAELTNLTRLDVRQNKIEELPSAIGRLQRLTRLDVHFNRLATMPIEVTSLSRLEQLNFSGNHLTALPSQITNLSNLTELNVSGNQLTELPAALGELANLRVLDLRGNDQLSVPPEIIEKFDDAQSILRYFQQVQSDQPKRELNEAKMLVVGEGEVGKTSLIKMLVSGECNPNERQTPGIRIRRWPLGLQDSLQLNVWDFGGQEIMHSTHQFFLSKRSLYLLVLNARDGEERGRLDYWLKLIESYGGDSPVIVVINKSDQTRLELNKRALLNKHSSNIRAFIETCCQGEFAQESGEPGNGIERLREAIIDEARALEHIHDPLLASWFELKKTLEDMEENYIPRSRYVALCQEKGIDDERDRQLLLGYLNDLGVVLTFEVDRLEDTNILNPQWVTGGIYPILNSNPLFRDKGVLDKRQLGEILDPEIYPPDKHDFLIGMMRKFELCFPFEGGGDRFLVPDLLPKDEPAILPGTGPLRFEYHYNVLPRSVISRFIVRMSHHIPADKQAYWRSGVVLTIDGNDVLVRADTDERRISVFILGEGSGLRGSLAVVRSNFDHIHRSIPGIEVKQMVPVPDEPGSLVSYPNLLEHERHGLETILPDGARTPVSVRDLLDGVDFVDEVRELPPTNFKTAAQRSSAHHTEPRYDIFVSYATGDRERIQPIVTALKNRGWRVFWDRSISPGQQWRSVLEERLKNAKAVVLAWSESSVGSRYVLDEAEIGLKQRTLVPVKLSEVETPVGFGQIQTANLAGWNKSENHVGFRALVRELEERIGRPRQHTGT